MRELKYHMLQFFQKCCVECQVLNIIILRDVQLQMLYAYIFRIASAVRKIMASYCQDSPVKKMRHKAKEKEPTQRRFLIHVVNVKKEVSAFTDCSWQVLVYLIDQLDVFGVNAELESGLRITIYLNDGMSIFFDIILVRSIFKWGMFFKELEMYPSTLLFTW